ncbi:polysaccharide biosynthesis C-terminal domain-containing protein [Gammaproteobacteria bacterium]|nr:polysaccharide biosynthesis C-terminal domain-containing protein [Gammaproteobacteria bacterium]
MPFYKNTFYTFLSHVFVVAQPIILVPLLINISSQELYAEYILLLSFLGIVSGISSLGFDLSYKRGYPTLQVTQEISSRQDLFFTQFWFHLFCSLIFSILCFLCIYLIVGSYVTLSYDEIWIVPIYIFANTFFNQFVSYARYSNRLGFHNFILALNPVLFIFFVLYFSSIHNITLLTLFFLHSLNLIMLGFIASFFVFKDLGYKFRFPSLKKIKLELIIGFPFLLTYVVETLIISSDRYLLAYIIDIKSVSYYVPAYILGSLPILIARVLGVVLPQILSICVDKNFNELGRNLTKQSKLYFLALSIPFFLGGIVIGEEVLSIYTNPEIAKQGNLVFSIISFSSIFFGLFIINSNIVFVRLKTKELFRVNLWMFLINFIFNFILLYLFQNINYAALVTLLSYIFGYILLNKLILKDNLFFKIASQDIIKIILSSAVAVLLLVTLQLIQIEYNIFFNIFLTTGIYFLSLLICFNKRLLSSFKKLDEIKFLFKT